MIKILLFQSVYIQNQVANLSETVPKFQRIGATILYWHSFVK